MTSDLLEENTDLRKQVEELENELTAEKEYNATLRKEIDEYTNSHTLCAKYKELEKENAKLKEFINAPHTKGRSTTRGDYIKSVWDLSKKLAEAKEIIKKMSDVYKYVIQYKEYANREILAEAEQFLQER